MTSLKRRCKRTTCCSLGTKGRATCVVKVLGSKNGIVIAAREGKSQHHVTRPLPISASISDAAGICRMGSRETKGIFKTRKQRSVAFIHSFI